MVKKLILLLIVIAIALLCHFLFKKYYRETHDILGYGTIEARETHVGSRIGGRVEQVHVKESDLVKAGATLISLESHELEAQKREGEAALKAAQAKESELRDGYREELKKQARAVVEEQRENFNKIRKGPREEDKNTQKAILQSADIAYKNAENDYQCIVKGERTVSKRELDSARTTRDMSQAKYNAEKAQYELLLAGNRPEDIAMAMQRLAQTEAELERLNAGPRRQEIEYAQALKEEIQARLDRIQAQLDECKILSPTDGRVEICDLERGDILAPGKTAVTMLKPDDLWVKIYIKEYELDRIHIDQEVEVIAEMSKERSERSLTLKILYSLARPPLVKKAFRGTIVHIASQAEFTPRNVQTKDERGNQVFAVKVKIQPPIDFLRPGISVMVGEKK